MGAKPGEGKQGHIGDGVFVAGGDKGQQAPPDGDKFGAALDALAHPDRQTDQPVTEHPLGDQRHHRQLGLGQGGAVNQAGAIGQQLAATGLPEEPGHQYRAQQIAAPALESCAHGAGAADTTGLDAEGQKHGVAGIELGTGIDHQGQGYAEGGAHHQRPQGRIHQVTQGEDQYDAQPHIGTGHHGGDPVAEGIFPVEFDDALGGGRALVDALRKHGLLL